MTVKLTVLAMTFGTAIGVLGALARLSRLPPLRGIAGLYIWVVRGIPLLLQLMFLYYGLAFTGILLDAFTVAVIGLSLCSGAYIAEIIRAAILSIDSGQWEAAFSLGMSPFQALRRVVLPQCYRRLVPPLGNEFITLMKDSALVSVICMTELLRSATLLQNATFRPVEIFSVAGLIYLALTTLFTVVLSWAERRMTQPGAVRGVGRS